MAKTKTYNPENERLKRRYLDHLKEARGYSEATLDGVAQALARFDAYNRYRPFRSFHFEQAKAFKRHLAEQRNQRTEDVLSKATLHQVLSACKAFFQWLAQEPGFRSRISYSETEYFNLTDKERAIAKAQRHRPVPTLEQITHVLRTMPSDTEVERRDRALIAFTLLTGARDGAIISMRLKHVDLAQGLVVQDAREVRTKFSKTFTTWFLPVGDEVLAIVTEWVKFLRHEKLWGLDDPLFPATRVSVGADHRFEAVGLERRHWSTATPVRRIFSEAFQAAGLPSFDPHSFRNTLAQFGEQRCGSPEEFKAWSQNLGHKQVLTTFTSYGTVAPERQGAIIRQLGTERADTQAATTLLRQLLDRAEAGRLA